MENDDCPKGNCDGCTELVEYVHRPGGQHFSVWTCSTCGKTEHKEDTL